MKALTIITIMALSCIWGTAILYVYTPALYRKLNLHKYTDAIILSASLLAIVLSVIKLFNE